MKTIKIINTFPNEGAQNCRVMKDDQGRIFLKYFKKDLVTEVTEYEGNEFAIDHWIENVRGYIKSRPNLGYKLWSY